MAPIDENPQLFNKHDFENTQCQQYERLNIINYGAYGVVFKARDKETDEIVAMKMLPALSEALTEINTYKSLTCHSSVVDFKGVVTDRRSRAFVVMEYVENDLHTLLYEETRENPFTTRDIKHVMKQLLEGVTFIHDKGVMHRDLKPSNILISDKEGKLKICDFGLSDRFEDATRESWDPNVGTLWYKAPELLEEKKKKTHSSPVDMWAVGCIMAELMLRQPLFQGNSERRSEVDQLAHIEETINPSCNRLRAKLGGVGSVTLTPLGLDLLERLLAYEPNMRITARDALNHPWFKEDLFGLHRIGDFYAWCNKKLKINFGIRDLWLLLGHLQWNYTLINSDC